MEVNELTIEEAIKYGHFLKRSEEDIAEAIDIYKTLGSKTFYGPEEENPVDQQEQPNNDYPHNMSQIITSALYKHLHLANRLLYYCFGKENWHHFPYYI